MLNIIIIRIKYISNPFYIDLPEMNSLEGNTSSKIHILFQSGNTLNTYMMASRFRKSTQFQALKHFSQGPHHLLLFQIIAQISNLQGQIQSQSGQFAKIYSNGGFVYNKLHTYMSAVTFWSALFVVVTSPNLASKAAWTLPSSQSQSWTHFSNSNKSQSRLAKLNYNKLNCLKRTTEDEISS